MNLNPIRAMVDLVKLSRKEAAEKTEQERLAAQEAMQWELATLERFARLNEAVVEAKRQMEVVISRMDEAAQQYTVQSAAQELCQDWSKLPRVVASLASSQCLTRHKAALLEEIKRQLIGGAEAEFGAFQEANADLLKKHGLVP
jgi:hypothetical protein